MYEKDPHPIRGIIISIIVAILLAICLTITSFAIVYAYIKLQNILCVPGRVEINSGDGKAVINGNGLLLEPGTAANKTILPENLGTGNVHCLLHFVDVNGGQHIRVE